MDAKCPIRPLLQVGESRFVRNKCIRENCGWYNQNHAACAILSISEGLDTLRDEMRELDDSINGGLSALAKSIEGSC